MIQVEQLLPEGDICRVRLSCSCGSPRLSVYECESDQIIFCTHCGEITSRNHLLNTSTRLFPAAIWKYANVSDRAECPLINVSLPATVVFNPEAPGPEKRTFGAVLTKISTEKCFFRLARETNGDNAAPETGGEVLLRVEHPELPPEIFGYLEETLQPSGANGPVYYKTRFVLTSIERKTRIEAFFQAGCGLVFEGQVLILCGEPDLARKLRQMFSHCLPAAMVRTVGGIDELGRALAEQPVDLLVTPPWPQLNEVIEKARTSGARTSPRVIALVKERSIPTLTQAIRWGADAILNEQCNEDEVRRTVQYCQHSSSGAAEVTPTPTPASQTAIRNINLDDDTINLLCLASETHDPNSSNHLKRIASYTAAIVRELGWSDDRVGTLAAASKLHDIGKIGQPDAILHKTGALTEEERRVMQEHTRFGYQILQSSRSELLRLGGLVALRHHERYDGGGYPDGLKGEAIPMAARVVSLADVFDALTTQRPYKPAWANEKAVSYIREHSGRMFSPEVVEAFFSAFTEVEQIQLRFLDDFRDVWTERRRHPRLPVPPLPLQVEISLPEQTFRPRILNGHLINASEGGMKIMLTDISSDLFTLLIASRRYARVGCLDPAWPAIDQVACGVSWLDYYAVPDPNACAMGVCFQRPNGELVDSIRRLARATPLPPGESYAKV